MQYLGNQPVQGIGRSKNLIPQYFYIGQTMKSNGVTVVGLDNGMLRITGISTARPVFTLIYERPCSLPAGTYSCIDSNIPQGTTLSYAFKLADGTTKTMYSMSGNKITLTQDAVAISVYFYGFVSPAVSTYDYTAHIMLVEYDGYYKGEYQPYLQRYDMYMYDNLIKLPYRFASGTDRNGMIATILEDGSVSLSGTFPSDLWGADYIFISGTLPKGKYVVKGCPSGGSSSTYRIFVHVVHEDGSNLYVSQVGQPAVFTIIDGDKIQQIGIRIGPQIGLVNNLVFKPELIKLIGD